MSDTGPADFEETLAELERIVRALDRDELKLEEALALFQTGVGHLRTATRLLTEAKGSVERLVETAAGDLAALGFELEGEGEGEGDG